MRNYLLRVLAFLLILVFLFATLFTGAIFIRSFIEQDLEWLQGIDIHSEVMFIFTGVTVIVAFLLAIEDDYNDDYYV
jgi:hypothetical protein